MDYGTVGVQEQRSLTFRIINKNPVEVIRLFLNNEIFSKKIYN